MSQTFRNLPSSSPSVFPPRLWPLGTFSGSISGKRPDQMGRNSTSSSSCAFTTTQRPAKQVDRMVSATDCVCRAAAQHACLLGAVLLTSGQPPAGARSTRWCGSEAAMQAQALHPLTGASCKQAPKASVSSIPESASEVDYPALLATSWTHGCRKFNATQITAIILMRLPKEELYACRDVALSLLCRPVKRF